ncbi:hypothetical protein ACW0JT_18660 [Arthrobacter sp. SA17]
MGRLAILLGQLLQSRFNADSIRFGRMMAESQPDELVSQDVYTPGHLIREVSPAEG